MKKKKNKIVIFFSLFFALIASFVIPTFAYHEDSNGNLVSDNILQIENISKNAYNVTISVNNGIFTINGTATGTGPLYFNCNISSGSYILSVFNSYISSDTNFYCSMRYTESNQIANSIIYCDSVNDYSSFTANNTINYFVVRVASGVTYDNVILKPMLVTGSVVPTSYESYGSIYYNSNNYNDAYNSGYDEGLNNAFKSILHYENLSSCYLQYSSTNNGTRYLGIAYNGKLCSSDVGRHDLLWSDANYEYPITTHWEENISTNYGLFYNTNWSLYQFIQEVADYPSINPDINSMMRFDFIVPVTLDSTGFAASGWRTVRFIDDFGVITDYDLQSGPLNVSVQNIVSILCFGLADFADDNYYLVSDPLGAYYFKGYTDGQNNAQIRYDLDVASLESQILNLKNTIATLNQQIYNMQNSEKNYQHLLWTVAGTPWESFNKIWNVEFGGINISNIVTGFITALIVIYIIKRIWK